jgi:hypothetical protein
MTFNVSRALPYLLFAVLALAPVAGAAAEPFVLIVNSAGWGQGGSGRSEREPPGAREFFQAEPRKERRGDQGVLAEDDLLGPGGPAPREGFPLRGGGLRALPARGHRLRPGGNTSGICQGRGPGPVGSPSDPDEHGARALGFRELSFFFLVIDESAANAPAPAPHREVVFAAGFASALP